jgi:hypothetical protein
MADEELLAEIPAPELTLTSTPESEKTETESPKTFTQEELDSIVGRRLAKEQRKWERQAVPAAPVAPPEADQFDSVEAYADALALQKAEELVKQRDVKQQQSVLVEAYHDREEEARGRYNDFEQVAYNPNLPITAAMAETIQSSEIGPDMAYYLGVNPKEADRISKLAPFIQAKELGRLEAKLLAEPATKRVSSAPDPISPAKPRGTSSPTFDTTDPRSIKSMTATQWIDAERQRQVRKFEAQKLR